MSRKRTKRGGRFIGIPFDVARSPEFGQLSSKATKLLIDLLTQYSGFNNGSLSACWTLMRERGWKSTATLYRAKRELIDTGFIVVTKSGMKKRGHPTLLAITWNGIDEPKKGYFDEWVIPSDTPLNYWCKDRSHWKAQPRLRVVGE